MKHQVYYITDTYCCWCFGFSKTINAIEKNYANQVQINVLNGVMVSQDMSLYNFFNRFPDPIGLHSHISEKSGQSFGSNYLDLIRNLKSSNRILNSNVPAKAMIAFKQLGVSELAATTKIQDAHYSDGIDIQRIESYEEISKKLSVPFDKFKEFYYDENCTITLNNELSMIRQLGISGFPAVLIKTKDDNFKVISNGFVSYDDLRSRLNKELEIDTDACIEN
ncbi:hypothetical protein EKO29_17675 [Colwellia sp. Arc7-635]|uniref:hypothetical protein n=1 Tax=Colwellia sp. Arc7-635 TaxID=2497879 RepID=UPI000F85076A|nr:hypothetical protein [Colwellia sp. Arc7-635]AZQ85661.1 hypothetical protein EKO29_17675 [Colwellia sp. Arc7-635]|tara:strand:+ start:1224 stop:1889 length:666 start_codon:yes stop_codon:yes gene_type:complete